MGSDGANTVKWTIETLDTAFATYPLLPENSPALQVFAGLGLSAVGLDVVTDFAAFVTGRDPLTGRLLTPRDRFYAWLAIGLPFITAGALHAFADDAIEFAADLRPLRNVECSFDADTPVTTDEGPVAIRDIDVGDKVLAWDESLAAGGYYTVTAVWAHEDPVTVLLTVDGETIETTPEHPFLTVDDTWVTAGKLAVGDTLRSADGDVGVVEEITFVAAPQVMYNMTVAVVHTYVVGDGEWVVHNSCGLPEEVVALPRVTLLGHGGYRKGDGFTIIPPDTYVVTYSKIGGYIHVRLGNAIAGNQVPETVYRRVWEPGSKIWNFVLMPPSPTTRLQAPGNPKIPYGRTFLDEYLQQYRGYQIHWASCTYCENARWTNQWWDLDGPMYPDQYPY